MGFILDTDDIEVTVRGVVEGVSLERRRESIVVTLHDGVGGKDSIEPYKETLIEFARWLSIPKNQIELFGRKITDD